MEKTNYGTKYYKKGLTIVCAIILGITIFITGSIQLVKILAILSNNNGEVHSNMYNIVAVLTSFFSISGILFIWCTLTLISILRGILRAKRENFKENKYIKNSNPYIYYRELPNNYGIGIATLLMDSNIENEKDIIAVILDLCAKKYLKLIKDNNNNYTVTVLKKTDDQLLSNEKYIMECINNNKIRYLDYDKWLDLCIKDGEKIGLYNRKKQNNTKEKHNYLSGDKPFNSFIIICLILDIIIGIIIFFISMKSMNVINAIITSVFLMIIVFFVLYIVLGMVLIVIPKMSLTARQSGNTAYETQRMKYLKLTEYGKEELQKMYAFKAFIKDFGIFASKNPEEIVIWEYYLSYAQVFGLTDQILKTGFKRIIQNGSFIIDDIDSINLSKLNIKF